MVKDKALTKTDLIKVLKDVGVATKDDVRQIIGEEITQRKLVARGDLKNFATKNDLKSFPTKDDLKSELGKSERRLERRLVVRMNKMGRDLQQSIANLAETTPTRQEFEILKQRVTGRYGLI
ncbi:MAG: hypothetical protein AAB430_02610 [Patescibacteria group bacterium]